MSDSFDDLDRALASGLSALAPDVAGGDDALASMRPRFERARARRRATRLGASVAVLFIAGSVAVLAAPSPSRSHVSVTSPPTTPGDTRPPVKRGTTTTVPKTSTTTVPAPSTTPSTNGSHNSGATTPTTPATGPVTVPNTAPNGGGPGPSDGGGDHGGASTTTSFTGTTGVRTYHSPGGSITVRVARGSVTLLHVDAASGYTSETHDSGPDRVDVRFTRGGQTYRIVLQVDDHGQVARTSHGDGPG